MGFDVVRRVFITRREKEIAKNHGWASEDLETEWGYTMSNKNIKIVARFP